MSYWLGGAAAGMSAVALLAAGLAGCGGHAAAPASPGRPAASPAPGQQEPTAVAAACPAATVMVSSSGALARALAAARPGQVIVLAPGRYLGHFVAAASGTPAAPITLCGPRSAILDGGGIGHGYTFYLNRASWWKVQGFTVTNGQKGVVADHASYDVLDGLYVHGVGDEAIHLRSFSSHNTVKDCVVRDTGLLVPFYGEGIYVGSAHKNWCRYSGCRPDASDDNLITGNDISGTTAENIDIKEGTTGGMIVGNRFDGAGMVGSAATAWVNVKGNDWTVAGNAGITSVKDGFQVHRVYPGWGEGNVFRDNTLQVDGPGYGIYVQSRHLGTVVACDNTVSGAGMGLSNIPCSPA